MSLNNTVNIYSKLFDSLHAKDLEYYKSFYTTRVHELALILVLSVNTESIATSSQLLATNVSILQEMYNYGLEFLVDAMQYSEMGEQGADGADPSSSLRKLSISLLGGSENGDQDESNDITSMTGKVASSLGYLEEEEDITTLGKHSAGPRPGSAVGSRRNSEVSSNVSVAAPSVRPHFAGIDAELRAELVANILRILELWFDNVTRSSIVLRRAKDSLGISSTSADLLTHLFEVSSNGSVAGQGNHTLTLLSLANLLSCLQWFLQYQFKLDNDTNYSAILGSVSLLYSMVKTLLKQYSHHQINKNSQLILSFSKTVDFAPELDKLLIASSNPKLSFNLNWVSRTQIYSIIGIFSLLEAILSTTTASSAASRKIDSSDITNFQNHHHSFHSTPGSNSSYFDDLKIFDYVDFQNQITYKINSLLSMDFKYWYEFKPDLLEASLTNSSFISWFTGNLLSASEYLNYNTSSEITSVSNNPTEFLRMDKDEVILKELEDVYATRYKKMKQNAANAPALTKGRPQLEPTLVSSTLLPILVFLNAHTKNSSFLYALTTPPPLDLHNASSSHIELLNILLCLSSYAFYYHHNSSVMRATSKAFLHIFIKLTSNNVLLSKDAGETEYTEYVSLQKRTVEYPINECKWKLCHQKEPLIPISKPYPGYKGFKSSALYIIDLIQVFMRFNMTKKLDIATYQMCNCVLYQLLKDITSESVDGLSSYQWIDFYKTIFNVLLFIKKQNLSLEAAPLVEEVLVIVDLMLFKYETVQTVYEATKPITYDLIYNILLHRDTIHDLIQTVGLKLTNLPYLSQCLRYLDDEFNSSPGLKLETVFNILELDYESPEFIRLLSGFKCKEHIAEKKIVFQLPGCFKDADQGLTASIGSTVDMFKIIDSTLNSV